MKRSDINRIIVECKAFLDDMKFRLPPWAYWTPAEWKGKRETCGEIVENMMGWDITDFGSGNFAERGLFLFTIRNGNLATGHPKPYAEKILIVDEEQETPMHFHWAKMEDIINRGGGNLMIELFGSTPDEEFSDEPVTVSIDGVLCTYEPGGTAVLTPGESICLPQRLYHRFYGEAGKGKVLVGEVSTVNDDSSDNKFRTEIGRFPAVDEDEAPIHLLVTDYADYL